MCLLQRYWITKWLQTFKKKDDKNSTIIISVFQKKTRISWDSTLLKDIHAGKLRQICVFIGQFVHHFAIVWWNDKVWRSNWSWDIATLACFDIIQHPTTAMLLLRNSSNRSHRVANLSPIIVCTELVEWIPLDCSFHYRENGSSSFYGDREIGWGDWRTTWISTFQSINHIKCISSYSLGQKKITQSWKLAIVKHVKQESYPYKIFNDNAGNAINKNWIIIIWGL